ncbi:hypothetical protein HDU99_007337 [Rhizoclosmatium hyalinum]|nr:hypothetical protein HDU99_007337 [Rhizoclosmatium hyalinum]
MLLTLVLASAAFVAAAPVGETLPHSVSWHLKDGVKKHEVLNLAPASAHLTYYGGPVIPNVEVHPIFYGNANYQSQTNSFYAAVTQSAWYDVLAQYNVYRGSAVPGFSVPATKSSLDDVNDIQPFLINLIKTGQIRPTANTYYPIHFAPGITITQGGGSSCSVFCAYHGTIDVSSLGVGTQYLFYGVMPDQGGSCTGGCGSNPSQINNMFSVASHELAEAATDAAVGVSTTIGAPLAWYDQTNGENGDICNAQQGTTVGADGVSYVVQKTWSNADNACLANSGTPVVTTTAVKKTTTTTKVVVPPTTTAAVVKTTTAVVVKTTTAAVFKTTTPAGGKTNVAATTQALFGSNLQMTQHPRLFEPIQLGRYQLKHRIALAPLTRCRADETDGEGNGQLPNELMAEYYGQRASDGGLLINEATPINSLTRFSERVPGIFTQKQIERWRLSTDAVHAKGGLIFLQLWHIGYHCRARFDPEGRLPPSASVILDEETGEPKSRELTVEEIKEIVQDYATAAKNSIEAGFDGVEIHGANTYLIDQFLSDKINKRNDDYGGSVEKRSRFLLEVVDAVVQAIGADRVGIRFSPWAISTIPVEQFSYALEKLNPYNLAFVHLVRQRLETPDNEGLRALRNSYKGVLILCRQYEPETAEKAVADGLADIIAFGKLFISNPDLPNRIRKGAALAPWDDSTFYSSGPVGYTDYKSLAEE